MKRSLTNNKSAYGLILALFAVAANAEIWQEAMHAEMALGDRDTRIAVRAAAIDDMRVRASQKVGMIVESSMQLSGNNLTEEIKTVGVSLVKIDKVTDEVKLQTDGSLRLYVSALVTVDESELDRRASAMRMDAEKANKIKQMTAENEVLRRSLTDITRMLAQQGNVAATADLLRQQAKILDGLSSNQDRVGQTFEQGSLLKLARSDAQAWQAIQTELETGIFERILAAPVTAKIVRVEDVQQDVRVLVQIGWKIDLDSIRRMLEQYISPTNIELIDKWGVGSFMVRGVGTEERVDRPYQRRVVAFIAQTEAHLELEVGGVQEYFSVLYRSGDRGYEPCEEYDGNYYEGFGLLRQNKVCFISLSKDVRLKPAGYGEHKTNPAILLLKKFQAERATQVKATWVIKAPDGKEYRRLAVIQ